MTVADDVLRALRTRSAPMTDAELARLLGKNHAQINQVCRRLADQGLLIRHGSRGDITNRVSDNTPTEHQPPRAGPAPIGDWVWEGNAQARLVTHHAKTDWNIVAVANTGQRERGAAIIADRDGERLFVEVKGWPSTAYARGDQAGQPKPTQPTLQATYWFAELLTSLIRRGAERGSRLAMALPDMPRYRTLLGEAAWALDRLDITGYMVTAEGAVRVWEREN